MEIGREREALAKERDELEKLIESPARQRTRLKRDLAALKDKFGDERRTRIEEVAAAREIDWSAMIEKEPITVILSQRGWIRAMKGHVALEQVAGPQVARGRRALHPFPRPDDGPAGALRRRTAGFIRWLATSCPSARGFGEPVRLFIDLDAEVDIVQLFVVRPEMKLLVASSDGKGFVASGEATLAETRKGKQLVNLRAGRQGRGRPAGARRAPMRSPWSARTGRCWSSRSPNCPSLARGQGVTLAALPRRRTVRCTRISAWPRGSAGHLAAKAGGCGPKRTSRRGARRAAPPGACRRSASRETISFDVSVRINRRLTTDSRSG